MTSFSNDFLWGASTAPHQIEGNNLNSDWWAREGIVPGMEASGDAVDSYHRYREDLQILADAGLNAYRFGIEWARIEVRPGQFSNAELAHYRRMIEASLELGVTPVVTLNHFTLPRWFADEGGWLSSTAAERFAAYVARAADILDGVDWIVTINEPNMLAMMITLQQAAETQPGATWQSPTVDGEAERERIAANLPIPSLEFAAPLISAHHSARDVLRQRTNANIGWSVANGAFTAAAESEEKLMEVRFRYEDVYLQAARGDSFIGVQSYSSQQVGPEGVIPHPEHPDNTQTGAAYRPDALGIAVRHAAALTGAPVLVTENGIATADDTRRVAYLESALEHLAAAMTDGVDVRGYLHWSLLDNFEWGHWGPKFGLVDVDRRTFKRTPKPSLARLGQIARRGLSST